MKTRAHRPEVVEQVKELRAQGLSYNKVAVISGIPKKTCILWCNPQSAARSRANRLERDQRPGERERRLAQVKEWQQKNYKKFKRQQWEYHHNVFKHTDEYKEKAAFYSAMRQHYKRGGFTYFEDDLGYEVTFETNWGIYPNFWSPEERKQFAALTRKARALTKQTGIEHHLDHILPMSLGGDHAPYNIQIITKEENLTKSNKYRPEDQTLYVQRIFELMQ